MAVKFTATPVKGKDLKEGDVFSGHPPAVWETFMANPENQAASIFVATKKVPGALRNQTFTIVSWEVVPDAPKAKVVKSKSEVKAGETGVRLRIKKKK